MSAIKLEVGKFYWAYYPDQRTQEPELFLCKVLRVGFEYCRCELYYDEDVSETPKRKMGTFNDVCTEDIIPL